jgi:hypothetical protein
MNAYVCDLTMEDGDAHGALATYRIVHDDGHAYACAEHVGELAAWYLTEHAATHLVVDRLDGPAPVASGGRGGH